MVTELLSIDFGAAKAGAENPTGEFFAGLENRALVSIVERFASLAGDDLPGDSTASDSTASDSTASDSTASDSTASASSPLVLYGPIYSGKTHLALGIAARWRAKQATTKVCVVTGADYAREFAQACRADAVDAFGARYRNSDLLILDALDELADKPGAQEHLCRTLDALRVRQAACMVTLRIAPSRLRGFAAALISRLAAGLCTPVALPANSTRCQLAMLFASRHGFALDQESCHLLAERLPSGTLSVASAVAQLAPSATQNITHEEVAHWLERQDRPVPLKLATIASVAARLCGTTVGEMKGPSRRKTHVQARGLAILAARKLTPFSLAAIGKHFGGRDHTTIMHACQTMESRIAADHVLQVLWEDLHAALQEQRCSEKKSPVGENASVNRELCS